ncbi:hypothetical protein IWW37_002205 [Coemansia sp. RSA 2050]|nr:hypothetical protein IWW37_002205 [Coemansia sp. RSA 2050]
MRRRAFATCSSRLQSPYPYHLVRVDSDPKAASVLFGLKFENTAPGPSTIIGWLKSSSETPAAATADGAEIRPAQFVENSKFWSHVEHVFREYAHEDPELQAQAAYQKSGWMNITDGRNPPPLGRTGEPEDIVGCVLVEDKCIKRGSFQPNPTHRLATIHGLFQLPRFLQAKLVDHLAIEH